jgi:hypothetical protein
LPDVEIKHRDVKSLPSITQLMSYRTGLELKSNPKAMILTAVVAPFFFIQHHTV